MTEWRAEAVCRGKTDLMFSERPQDVAAAKALCASCPARWPCLLAAVADEADKGRYDRYGVYGAMTPDERTEAVAALGSVKRWHLRASAEEAAAAFREGRGRRLCVRCRQRAATGAGGVSPWCQQCRPKLTAEDEERLEMVRRGLQRTGSRKQPRLSVWPVIDLINVREYENSAASAIAALVGISKRNGHRWMVNGAPLHRAYDLSEAVGCTPGDLWPDFAEWEREFPLVFLSGSEKRRAYNREAKRKRERKSVPTRGTEVLVA